MVLAFLVFLIIDHLDLKNFYQNKKVLYVLQRTPGEYELSKINNEVVEKIIRPTRLLDPIIEVRSFKN